MSLFTFGSEGQSQRELDLPWVIQRPRRAVIRVGRTVQESLRRRTALGRCVKVAEIGCAIHRVKEPYVDGVQEVECLSHGFNVQALCRLESAGNPHIDGLITISLERVARLDSDAVVVSKDVAIGIKAGELGEI